MRISLVQEIKDGKWNSMLGQEDITAIIALSLEQLSEKIAGFSLVPMRIESRLDMALFRIYFTSCWLEVYDKVSLNSRPRVLEIAPGQFDPIPQSLEIASSGSGEYVTANLNRQLSARLRENTKALNITVRVIEDNALNLRNHLREQYFDLDYGAPLDLYSSFIQMAKDWITMAGIKLSLVEFPGFDPKWWLFLRKD